MAVDELGSGKLACSNCGASYEGGAKLCSNCSAPLAHPSSSIGRAGIDHRLDAGRGGARFARSRLPWYGRPGVIVLLLLFCFPVGLGLMWGYAPWTRRTKQIVTAIFIWPLGAWWITKQTEWPRWVKGIAWGVAALWCFWLVTSVQDSQRRDTVLAEARQAAAATVASDATATAITSEQTATVTALTAAQTATATAAQNAKIIVGHLGAANSFRDAKNWPAADKEFDAVLALDARNQDALAGKALVEATATAEAHAAATAAAQKAITDHLGAASSFVEAKNWPAALKEYNAALAIDPNDPDARSAKDKIVAPMREYASKVSPELTSYTHAVQGLGPHLSEVGGNPYLMLDPNWKLATATYLAELNVSSERFAAVPAPPAFAHIQTLLQSIQQETHAMANQLAGGIDGMNPSLVSSATTHMNNVVGLLNQAAAELQQLQGQV